MCRSAKYAVISQKQPQGAITLSPSSQMPVGQSRSRSIWAQHPNIRLLYQSRATPRYKVWSHNQALQVPVCTIWYSWHNDQTSSQVKLPPATTDFNTTLVVHTTHKWQSSKRCRLLRTRTLPCLALLELQNTPINDQLGSPAQTYISNKLFVPKTIKPEIVQLAKTTKTLWSTHKVVSRTKQRR